MPRICAGIVSYNPDVLRLKENIYGILPQVEKVYIIDNGSGNIGEVEKLCMNESKLEIIENRDNYGIAKALNQVCAIGVAEGYDWILTLDQDTSCPPDMIQKMIPYTVKPELGIICPAVYYEGWDKNTAAEEPTTYVYACMTSASLTRIEAWNKVGGFREEYFIDFVDNEFCMKLKISGYKVLRINDCVISHRLGEHGERKIFGLIIIRYAKHSPFRLYYMVRNNLLFIEEYKRYLPVTKEKIKLAYIVLTALLFNDNRNMTYNYILKGVRDAKRHAYGKLLESQ